MLRSAGSPEVAKRFARELAVNDDVDLFGSDEEEDAEAARVREERLAGYRLALEDAGLPLDSSLIIETVASVMKYCPKYQALADRGPD